MEISAYVSTQKRSLMALPHTSVVILNWNTRELLQQFLPTVIKHSWSPGIDIVVADNGSTDGSVEMVREQFSDKVRILEFDRNYGFAGGYNLALKQIETKYAVLLNSDAAPAQGWLEPLVKCLDENPGIGACVPKIKAYKQPDMFEYAGAAGGFIDKLGYTFCRGRIFDFLEKDHGQYDDGCDVFWGSGAALMVRTGLFNQSGGLDEDFFAHMEEIDWCWRIKNQGYRIRYVPESTIYHLGGGTLNNISPHKNYLNFRNNLYMLYRNLPKRKLWRILLQRMLMDYMAAFHFLFLLQPNHFGGIFRAHFAFFKNFRLLRQKRKVLKMEVRKEEHSEIYPRPIVFDFFFRKRKKFSS
ncbi:MAG: glycosyltransferase family 2 protein, partial [Marinilabiliaceae bacterium]